MKKTNAARILESQGVPYETREYEVDADDLSAPKVAQAIGLPPEQVFKTLVARGDKTGVLLACLPGSSELNLKALAKASGNKTVELAPVKDIQNLTGYIRGGVSPVGTKKAYPVYLDSSAGAMAGDCGQRRRPRLSGAADSGGSVARGGGSDGRDRDWQRDCTSIGMIRKLKSGEYRLYSRKLDPKSGKRKNLGTFGTREEAEKHERAVQYFKRAH